MEKSEQATPNKTEKKKMNNKYLPLLIALLYAAELQAQSLQPAPRLVVNITVDQLRTDYIEYFAPLYSQDGFRKILQQGRVYEAANYPFSPIDRASAIATIATGTTPYYHGIIASRWLDRSTLRAIHCVDDPTHYTSPWRMQTTALADELKATSHGSPIAWAVAADREAAVLSAGHAADGALWMDERTNRWRSSTYYNTATPTWLKAYSSTAQQPTNAAVADMAVATVTSAAMGMDEITDYLAVTLSAVPSSTDTLSNWQTNMEPIYLDLDRTIGKLISNIEAKIGAQHVMFVLTSTGYEAESDNDLATYRIPTSTFKINRTANLLNVFLSAIYGQARYVVACYRNEVYLDHQLIEQKRIATSDILHRAQEFLILNQGVADVYTSERLLNGNNDIQKLRNGFNPSLSGDIIIQVKPGWRLLNEETQQSYIQRASFVPFPIIFYGATIKAEHITTPVSTDRIAPTIAKAIRIRAPNACSAEPLF